MAVGTTEIDGGRPVMHGLTSAMPRPNLGLGWIGTVGRCLFYPAYGDKKVWPACEKALPRQRLVKPGIFWPSEYGDTT